MRGLQRQGIPADLFSIEQEDCLEHLQDHLANKSYAVVHAFHLSHFGRLLVKVPGLRRYPLVLTITGTDIHVDLEQQQALAFSTLQAISACVVFNPAFVPTLTSLLKDAQRPRIEVIAQGVDLPPGPPLHRSVLDLSENDVVFLMPTGMRPIKNIEMALDGLDKLVQEDNRVKLLLMGPILEPHYGAWILDRLKHLPWASYLGEIPHDHIAGVLSTGDIVLNCSQSEGQPQAALEAMSLGIPAILSLVPGNIGILEEGKQGFYASGVHDFVEKCRVLLNNPDLRRRMGLAARNLVRRSFNPEVEVKQHIQLYQSILLHESL